MAFFHSFKGSGLQRLSRYLFNCPSLVALEKVVVSSFLELQSLRCGYFYNAVSIYLQVRMVWDLEGSFQVMVFLRSCCPCPSRCLRSGVRKVMFKRLSWIAVRRAVDGTIVRQWWTLRKVSMGCLSRRLWSPVWRRAFWVLNFGVIEGAVIYTSWEYCITLLTWAL